MMRIVRGTVVASSVTAIAANAITAAAIATGAIDADAIAADAGTELATATWASAARELTDLDLREDVSLSLLDSWPPSTQGYTDSGGVADTFGAWFQLVADVGVGKRLLELSIRPGAATAFEVEVGEGAAGFEVTIARQQAMCALGVPVRFLFFKALTNNARLSYRVRDAQSAAQTYYAAPVIG